MSTLSTCRWAVGLLLLAPLLGTAQDEKPRRQGARTALALPADVVELERFSVILGRPTAHSIALSLLSQSDTEAQVQHRPAHAQDWVSGPWLRLTGAVPQEVELADLAPNQAYRYRVLLRPNAQGPSRMGAEHSFHTQRAPGSRFVFELQGDSHPERGHQFHPELYAQTLRAAAADRPDFYLTLGDDFSVDTLPERTAATVAQRYQLQRPFLALVGQTAPLFLVNGNHEQASRANLDGSPHNVAVWAQTARNRLFPLPAPNAFYSGNTTPVEHIGLLRDYHAWTWGDALFVIIDPYWHSPQTVDNPLGHRDKAGGGRPAGDSAEGPGAALKGKRDLWAITLGEAQYRWLAETLASSSARFKFVFAHHVLGTGRGGVEMAGLYEWGGKDPRGRDEFAQRRPGWPLPIHGLFVKHGVTAFFQGHDHVFVRQELDGVTYQTAPEPADPNYAAYFFDRYRSGDRLPNSGRIRVTVEPDLARVEYLRSWLPGEHPAGQSAQSPAFVYELRPR
ncbi:metallophosphoesterase family protein [Inhella gelatinilytica]|uniref:Metallophosphoesterase n=1 Tax=Inhella gelatinilytica TaxID=2795030 RepID=A0A931J1X1_9BURK|nr:metallophosphoesterase [Inhella gelatinilytica]MBH9553846.1 metallophosphoesterase [Inhella gelatinilytica]